MTELHLILLIIALFVINAIYLIALPGYIIDWSNDEVAENSYRPPSSTNMLDWGPATSLRIAVAIFKFSFNNAVNRSFRLKSRRLMAILVASIIMFLVTLFAFFSLRQ